MSKKNAVPLTLDDEQEERAKYAGMLKGEILEAAGNIGVAKERSAKISGDLSAQLQNFEDKGGVKKMLKWAKSLADMEPGEAQSSWRCLVGYCEALGVFDQMDMFEQEQTTKANMTSLKTASAGPKYGEEPAVLN